MIVKKMCPYKTKPRHFIDIDTDLYSCNCPVCDKPISISHCLCAEDGYGKKTGGITLYPMETKKMTLQERVREYLKDHAGKSIADISRDLKCSPGKMWYVLRDMDEVVIEKKGRRCYVGVKA